MKLDKNRRLKDSFTPTLYLLNFIGFWPTFGLFHYAKLPSYKRLRWGRLAGPSNSSFSGSFSVSPVIDSTIPLLVCIEKLYSRGDTHPSNHAGFQLCHWPISLFLLCLACALMVGTYATLRVSYTTLSRGAFHPTVIHHHPAYTHHLSKIVLQTFKGGWGLRTVQYCCWVPQWLH